MIALLPDFPDWTAIVTGRVTAEHQAFAGDLQRRVAAAGLADRIVFLGEVPDIKLWYRRISLYVAPSRNEGFGLTPLEAMASGSPVVASDAGAYADLIAEGETGFVVPAGDGAALTRAIRAYLSDPALLEAHRANALADVRKRFPLQGEADAIGKVYEGLVGGELKPGAGASSDVQHCGQSMQASATRLGDRHHAFVLDLADGQRGAHRVDIRRRGQLFDDEGLEGGEVACHAMQQEVGFARYHPGRRARSASRASARRTP